jgi:hypothetical protein
MPTLTRIANNTSEKKASIQVGDAVTVRRMEKMDGESRSGFKSRNQFAGLRGVVKERDTDRWSVQFDDHNMIRKFKSCDLEKIVINDEDKENRRPAKIARRESNHPQGAVALASAGAKKETDLIAKIAKSEHRPSASPPGVVPPASFVPHFARRLPKTENYVEAILNDGTNSIQLFVPNDSNAGAAGLDLAKTLFEHNHILIRKFTLAKADGSLATAEEISSEFLRLVETQPLFVNYWSRGFASSGWNNNRMMSLIRNHSPLLSQIFDSLGQEFNLDKTWLGANESGYQDWHGDGGSNEAILGRGIGTLLSVNKFMWFRDKTTGASFGLRMQHCSAIFMSRVGSGMEGNMQHCVTGAEKTYLFAADIMKK